MNHLLQPNKTITFHIDAPLRRTYANGETYTIPNTFEYSFEMEPVLKRQKGKLVPAWRSVPDESAEDLRFDLFLHRTPQKEVSEWEAIHIFREDLYGIAMGKINAGEDPEHFQGLIEKSRKQDHLKMEERKRRAKEVSILNVARGFGLEPRMGFIPCPFHADKTASMKLYIDNNTWHCFGACASGGDTIDFVMKKNGCSFAEAVEFLV